ncbi:hypothetical protein TNCV_2465361 [Trichonephila clavipes]|uniref:Uncharacterized protein n=1 Tax=Trichonephila clavipes TaxID=2585209 RepID=A0A8X6UU05_TRICX|nr:hypothetical protein TNCV_2465361 [Trichonephila clavipes]
MPPIPILDLPCRRTHGLGSIVAATRDISRSYPLVLITLQSSPHQQCQRSCVPLTPCSTKNKEEKIKQKETSIHKVEE